ncbi:ribonuclease T2 [Acephala macrosclerotiorum]|nr:ribonuclease T2 [Acephala macrosclerotiorum]
MNSTHYLKQIKTTLTTFLSQLPLFSNPQPQATQQTLGNAPSCPIDSPISCQADAEPSCCFVYPGGQLLQTQFWDTSPSIGPQDSWTLHGLWPDLCDGSYDQFCTSAPQYHNITSIIESSGNTELLEDMEKYWLPNAGTLEHFWQHEWNKHGTCINTLAPSCYGYGYSAGQEVVDFFERAVGIFKGLDTYAALASAGIEPSHSKTYTYSEIEDALTSVTGSAVVLGCNRGKLNQAWYSFHVRGSLQTGSFVPSTPVGKGMRGNCPRRGIKYLPK